MSLWNLNPREALQRLSEAAELSRFYRAFSAAYSSGLPLLQGLELLSSEEYERTTRQRATALRTSIARGGTLGEGARQGRFLALEEALLALGEQTGRLEVTLPALSRFFDADDRIARRIKASLAKPFITGLVACFVLPLPIAFQVSTTAYLATALPMFALLLLLSGTVLAARFTAARNQPRFAIARMLWALAIAIESGVSIDQAVRLAAAALGPCSTSRALLKVPATHWQGRPLSQTLGAVCRLPATAHAVVQTMERTGDTSSTLRWLAKAYEEGTIDAR